MMSPKLAGLFRSHEELVNWYVGLGSMRIFWAKPVRDVRVIGWKPLMWRVDWDLRRGVRGCVIGFVEGMEDLNRLSSLAPACRLAITPLSLPPDSYTARSMVFFYVPGQRVLEPNPHVDVKVYEEWDEKLLEVFRSVQKKSWGFFKEPVKGVHRVLLGFLGGEAVAMTYLNPISFNLDYGVHVVRAMWRRRIGTRMLHEALILAGQLRSNILSVVRVLRSREGTSSDRRAVAFYKANNPALTLNVYRLL